MGGMIVGKKANLEQVMDYPLPPLIERFQQKLGLSQDAAMQLFDDTKRFLYLCGISDKPIAPNETLDFGWHQFLLFSEEYADFCQKNFGRFIHHRPTRLDNPPPKGEMSRRAVDLAKTVFGENLSSNWHYPLLGNYTDPCAESCGCSAACND
jgi:hypothetical protein